MDYHIYGDLKSPIDNNILVPHINLINVNINRLWKKKSTMVFLGIKL